MVHQRSSPQDSAGLLPTSTSPAASVIIVTHNSVATVGACLAAIPAAAAGTIPFEIIVVDTASHDGTPAVVRASAMRPTLVEVENRGFSAAANRGAAAARGEFLLFLNPDTVLPPGGLRRLSALCSFPRVAAVSGVLVDTHGITEPVGEPLPSFSWYLRRRFPSPTAYCLLPTAYSVPWLSGAAFLVRREVFCAVGGFDERYFLYYEDIDFSRKLRAAGGVLLVDPTVRIRHQGGQSASRRARVWASDGAEDLYFSRYRPRWEHRVLRLIRAALRLVPSLPLLAAGGFLGPLTAQVLTLPRAVGLLLAFVLATVSARAPDAGALLLLLSVLPGQLLRIPLPLVGSVTLTDAVLPIVLSGWVWSAFWRGGRRLRSATAVLTSSSLLAVTLLPGLLLATERLAPAEWATAAGYASRLLLILAVIPLAARVLRHPGVVPVGLVVFASILAVLGFAQLHLFPTTAELVTAVTPSCLLPPASCLVSGWDPHPSRLFATWLDPNLLGGFFLIGVAVLLVLPVAQTLSGVVLATSAGAVLLPALLLTKSRTSLSALLGMLAVSLLLTRPGRRLAGVLSLTLLGVLFTPAFANRVFSLHLSDPTAAQRLQSWGQALGHVRDRPLFGLGYNTYGFAQLSAGNISSLDLHSRAAADNSLLTFLATTGLLGVGILLLLLTALGWGLIRRARFVRGFSWISAAAALAFGGLLLHAQFVHSLVYIHLAVPLALLVGAALAAPRQVSPNSVRPS